MLTNLIKILSIFGLLRIVQPLGTNTLRPSSTTVRPLIEKFITKNDINNDGLIKRNIKVEDISKTFEPSTQFRSPNFDREREEIGFDGAPMTFSQGQSGGYSYDSKYRGKGYLESISNQKNKIKEQFGIGSSSSYGSNRYGGGTYTAYATPLDYPYSTSGGGYQSNYDTGYGSNYGGDYSSNSQDVIQKIAYAKKIILPIAGVAALGLAAAYIVNPLLFQSFGSFGSSSFGKRKRRDLENSKNDSDSQKLAYRNWSR